MKHPTQRLELVRFMLVLSAFSPVFVLWAVRGPVGIPEMCTWGSVFLFGIVPNFVLYCRYKMAVKELDRRVIKVTRAVDSSENLLIYLFAVLLPLYDANIEAGRDKIALGFAFIFVIFIFWHLDLNYLNLMFAILGYRLYALDQDAESSHSRRIIILTPRHFLTKGTEISAYRLCDTVYIEPKPKS